MIEEHSADEYSKLFPAPISRFGSPRLMIVQGHVRTSAYRTPTFQWRFHQLQKFHSNASKKNVHIRIKTFFTFKDKLLNKLRSEPAYKYKCYGYNAIFYGKTKRHFKV